MTQGGGAFPGFCRFFGLYPTSALGKPPWPAGRFGSILVPAADINRGRNVYTGTAMFKTLVYSGIGLGAALLGPYLFFSASDHLSAARESIPGIRSAGVLPGGVGGAPSDASFLEHDGTSKPLPPLGGLPVSDFAEVFRFDVSPRWIAERWPHVSTGLAQLQLNGHRVPLVTGTEESDLAGALTYYFSPRQRVERLVFHGTTGDPSKLVAFLNRHYRFVHRPVNDPGLFIYESVDRNGNFGGAAEIRSSWTIRADEPLRRYQVKLQLERPT